MARKASTPLFPIYPLLTYILLAPSPMAAEDPNSHSDRKELEDKFAQLRPEVLETLRMLFYTVSLVKPLLTASPPQAQLRIFSKPSPSQLPTLTFLPLLRSSFAQNHTLLLQTHKRLSLKTILPDTVTCLAKKSCDGVSNKVRLVSSLLRKVYGVLSWTNCSPRTRKARGERVKNE